MNDLKHPFSGPPSGRIVSESACEAETDGAELAVATGDASSPKKMDVYRSLKNEIIKGELRPNEAIVEADLAERFAVSRTPVRESMQRLATEGLIVSRRRRWVVYEHSPAEITEIYEVRAGLESHAARLAVTRATQAQRDTLASMRGIFNTPTTPLRERIEVNENFHRLVVQASGNSRLADEVERQRVIAFNYKIAAMYGPQNLEESSRQHDAMIDAILAGDEIKAADEARAHVEYSLQMILDHMI